MSMDMPSKNILVLGNGFDLYHNLKTKYSDYIKFMSHLKNDYETCANGNKRSVISLDDMKKDALIKRATRCLPISIYREVSEETMRELISMLNNNFVQYFMLYNAEVKGWIDFEVLIKNITTDIEKVMNRIDSIEVKGKKYKNGIIGNAREILLANCFDKIFQIDKRNKIYVKKELANYLEGIK